MPHLSGRYISHAPDRERINRRVTIRFYRSRSQCDRYNVICPTQNRRWNSITSKCAGGACRWRLTWTAWSAAGGGPLLLETDPRLQKLRDALGVLLKPGPNRAEQVQLIFSDKTPPPR